MRLKPNHIYLLVIAILVSFSYSYAQESVSPVLEGMEAEKSTNSGMEYNYSEGEGSAQRLQSINTPTVTQPSQGDITPSKSNQVKPKASAQKAASETQPKPEESVLGFNFLYYIFQKYKMSDIID